MVLTLASSRLQLGQKDGVIDICGMVTTELLSKVILGFMYTRMRCT
jgi:hypothetical protein